MGLPPDEALVETAQTLKEMTEEALKKVSSEEEPVSTPITNMYGTQSSWAYQQLEELKRLLGVTYVGDIKQAIITLQANVTKEPIKIVIIPEVSVPIEEEFELGSDKPLANLWRIMTDNKVKIEPARKAWPEIRYANGKWVLQKSGAEALEGSLKDVCDAFTEAVSINTEEVNKGSEDTTARPKHTVYSYEDEDSEYMEQFRAACG